MQEKSNTLRYYNIFLGTKKEFVFFYRKGINKAGATTTS